MSSMVFQERQTYWKQDDRLSKRRVLTICFVFGTLCLMGIPFVVLGLFSKSVAAIGFAVTYLSAMVLFFASAFLTSFVITVDDDVIRIRHTPRFIIPPNNWQRSRFYGRTPVEIDLDTVTDIEVVSIPDTDFQQLDQYPLRYGIDSMDAVLVEHEGERPILIKTHRPEKLAHALHYRLANESDPSPASIVNVN
jgi:hypothetical protein